MELHNRDGTTRPWSLRQTGIYQQIELQSRKSTWILLQPSEGINEGLLGRLSNKSPNLNGSNANYMLLHIHFLSLMASNWGEYIEYLWAEANTLVSTGPIECIKTPSTYQRATGR